MGTANSVTRADSGQISTGKISCVGTPGFATSTGRSVDEDPEAQFREELKARGAALQDLFWQELERTRNRLRDAGFVNNTKTRPDAHMLQKSQKDTPTLPCRSFGATTCFKHRSD